MGSQSLTWLSDRTTTPTLTTHTKKQKSKVFTRHGKERKEQPKCLPDSKIFFLFIWWWNLFLSLLWITFYFSVLQKIRLVNYLICWEAAGLTSFPKFYILLVGSSDSIIGDTLLVVFLSVNQLCSNHFGESACRTPASEWTCLSVDMHGQHVCPSFLRTWQMPKCGFFFSPTWLFCFGMQQECFMLSQNIKKTCTQGSS